MKFYEWLNVRPPSNRKTDDAIVRFMNSGEIPDSIWHPNFRWTTYEEYWRREMRAMGYAVGDDPLAVRLRELGLDIGPD